MMTGSKALSNVLCLSVLLCFIASASAQEHNPAPFELAAVYKTQLATKATGWYSLPQHIVFIADLERTSKTLSKRDMQAKAMLTVRKQVRSWSVASKPTPPCDVSRWPKRTQAILLRFLEHHVQIPALGQFSGQVLENTAIRQRYRYAYAVPTIQLERFRSNIQHISTTPMALFSQTLEEAIHHEDYQEAAILLWDTGLPHLAARAAQEAMSKSYNMVNFALSPSPPAQREAVRQLLAKELATTPESLQKIPGSLEILLSMASSRQISSPEQSFALRSLALAASSTQRRAILDTMQQANASANISTENLTMNHGEIVRLSLACLGNLRFGETIPATEPPILKQAIELFNKHGDKQHIADLLITATDKVPANPKVWDYLAAVLKAQQRWEHAAIMYLQLLELRPFESEAIAHLAQCYSQIGNHQQAKTIADFLVYSGRSSNDPVISRITQDIRR